MSGFDWFRRAYTAGVVLLLVVFAILLVAVPEFMVAHMGVIVAVGVPLGLLAFWIWGRHAP